MNPFVLWLQENVLWLLTTQLVVVAGFAAWLFVVRLRQKSARALEPAAGDRNTVVLPEEDAAQMFATLTALQEELERYRRAAGPLPPEESVRATDDGYGADDRVTRYEEVPVAFDQDEKNDESEEDRRPRSTAASAVQAGSRVLEDLVEEDPEQDFVPREILDERRADAGDRSDDRDDTLGHPAAKEERYEEVRPSPEGAPVPEAPRPAPTEAERILKEWFADLEELTRRSRREAF